MLTTSAHSRKTACIWPPVESVGFYLPRANMNKFSAYGFYLFGQSLFPLTTLPVSEPIQNWYPTIKNAVSWIENTRNNPIFKLTTSEAQAAFLSKMLSDLLDLPSDTVTTSEMAGLIGASVYNFQATLQAELGQAGTFFVSPKGAYSTLALVENGELLLPESTRNLLTKEAIDDMRNGARCMAFELPTAAAFHFLRAVEAALHQHYDALSNGAPRPARGAMGIYINEIIALNAQQELVAVLKQIKDLHRNPIMHPDAVVTMEEVQIIVGIAQSAIFALMKIVTKSAPAPASPPASSSTPTPASPTQP